MSFISQSQKYLGCGLLAVAVIAMAVPAWAQFPELELTMSDTTVTAGDTSAWISVKIRNYQDTLSGFAMRIVLNRPDIMEFRTDEIDTVIDTLYYKCLAWYDGDCIDSQLRPVPLVDTFLVNRAVDTTGSLVRYWSNITVRSMSPSRHDLKVIGLADELGMPYTPGIKPRTSQGLLFRARVRVYDSLPPTDSVVTLYFIQNLSETNFPIPWETWSVPSPDTISVTPVTAKSGTPSGIHAAAAVWTPCLPFWTPWSSIPFSGTGSVKNGVRDLRGIRA